MTKINPEYNQTTISAIFKKQKKYRVADFQRNYIWGSVQQKTLVSDLISHLNQSSPSSFGENFSGNFFFLGTIITYATDATEKNKSNGILYIVDGQQRLISISILLTVIRDILVGIHSTSRKNSEAFTLSKQISDSINKVLKNTTDTKEDGFVVLPHIDSDQEFFEDVLYNQDTNNNMSNASSKGGSEKNRYFSAYIYMKAEIDDYIDDKGYQNNKDKVNWIVSLYKQILNSSITELTMDSSEEAYEVYSDINFKGMPLTTVDLLKNNLMQTVRNETYTHKNRILKLWNELQDLTQDIDFMTCYKYSIFIINGYEKSLSLLDINEQTLPDKKDLPDLLKSQFKDDQPFNQIKQFLTDLKKLIRIYKKLIESDFRHIGKNNNWPFYTNNLIILYKLSKYDLDNLNSFVYFLMPIYESLSSNSELFKKWIELIGDFYAVGLLINMFENNNNDAKISYKNLHDKIFLLAIKIKDKKTFDINYQIVKTEFTSFLSDNIETIKHDIDSLRYGNGENAEMKLLCNYFLRQIEGEKMNNLATPSIEHIIDKEYGKDDTHGNPYNALGNLLVLEQKYNEECETLKHNNASANNPVHYKEETYNKSDSNTVKQFLKNYKLYSFSEQELTERTKELTNTFINKYI